MCWSQHQEADINHTAETQNFFSPLSKLVGSGVKGFMWLWTFLPCLTANPPAPYPHGHLQCQSVWLRTHVGAQSAIKHQPAAKTSERQGATCSVQACTFNMDYNLHIKRHPSKTPVGEYLKSEESQTSDQVYLTIPYFLIPGMLHIISKYSTMTRQSPVKQELFLLFFDKYNNVSFLPPIQYTFCPSYSPLWNFVDFKLYTYHLFFLCEITLLNFRNVLVLCFLSLLYWQTQWMYCDPQLNADTSKNHLQNTWIKEYCAYKFLSMQYRTYSPQLAQICTFICTTIAKTRKKESLNWCFLLCVPIVKYTNSLLCKI